MILEKYRQTTDYKSQTVKQTPTQNNYSVKGQREFLTPTKTAKMRPLRNIAQFVFPNGFDT